MKKIIQQFTQVVAAITCCFLILTTVSCSNEEELPEGKVRTIVHDLPANDGLSIDKNGNIYASNFGSFGATTGNGTQVYKISPDGSVRLFADSLDGPLGSTIDRNGNLVVVSGGINGKISRITQTGKREILATIGGWPAGVTTDLHNNIYITNYLNPTIHKISRDGVLSTFIEDERLRGSVGIVFDDKRNEMYVANYNDGKIYRLSLRGDLSQVADLDVVEGFGVGYITLMYGRIFATGIGNNYIYEISLKGDIRIVAGTGNAAHRDGPAHEAEFFNPNGITANPFTYSLYVLDYGSQNLRIIEFH